MTDARPRAQTPPSPTQAAKRSLRQAVLERRAALGPDKRRAASASILARVTALPAFQRARGVHLFLSFPDEVDTAPIVAACARQGRAIFLPYRMPGGERLGCARWQPGEALVDGPFGTREPARRDPVDPSAIDLVLVPGVAFDRRGNRLGYGKGFYDRFLAELAQAASAAPVALAFSVQIVESVPTDAWDIGIPCIVTENETIAP
jgi:5-formyltetrahydrofolate cyclo-ligase